MGISGFDTCDFVVYSFKDLIIVRTGFDVSSFDRLVQKLNSFYTKITWNSYKLDKLTKATQTFLQYFRNRYEKLKITDYHFKKTSSW